MRAGPKREITAAPLDLRKLPKRDGSRAISFIERYIRVTKGKGARNRMVLRPFQKAIAHELFDEPRPRQGLVSVSRGNGKTTLAAALALYGLLGDGVEGAQVICVASDERQAGITLRIARRMVELEPLLEARVQVFQDRLYVPATDSSLFALPADAGGLQGWDPSLCIVDELHVVTENVFEAMSLAAGKRQQSLLLAISTPAGDTDSVMWRLVEHGREGGDPGFRFIEYAAPAGCALDDEQAWGVANPALHDFLAVDALRATLATSREASFRRFRLGQWVQDDAAWLPAGAWTACEDPRSIPQGADVVLGFDGSFSGDCTALVAVQLGEVPHVQVVELWDAPPGARDWRVPVLDVEESIREACRRWSVRQIVADPFRWARSLQILEGEGLPVEEFPQSPARMTPATTRLYEAIVNGAMTHSGDQRLARHVGNCILKVDARGSRLAKEHRDSKRRIDLAVAAVMAFERAATLEPEAAYDPLESIW